jgi:hypothetical protein
VEETGGPGDNINTIFYDNSNISDGNSVESGVKHH